MVVCYYSTSIWSQHPHFVNSMAAFRAGSSRRFTGLYTVPCKRAQWLCGRVLDSRPRGHWFEPHWRHCVVSLSKNMNPSLVLVQPKKSYVFITETLLMGRKESNQTKQFPLPAILFY